MPDKKFDLGDYVEVKDRIKLFYELYAGGRLVTGEIRLSNEPDGKPRVLVQGLAYRTVDDPLPGVGWSWMELPGSSPYTKGSELENTETSAWGRAIASLGILVDRSIASAQEVQNKEQTRDDGQLPVMASTGPDRPQLVRAIGEQGLIGKVATSGTSDFNLRETPDGGFILPFRVKEGNKAGQIVVAEGDLAVALEPFRDSIMGERVTVWGRYSDEESPPKADGYVVRYKVLHLSKIQTPDWTLPVEVAAEPVDDDLSDVPDGAWVASEESDAGSRR